MKRFSLAVLAFSLFLTGHAKAQTAPVITPTGNEIVSCVKSGVPKSCTTQSIGNLGASQGTQSARTVLAGPLSGSAALPTFRILQTTDIPTGTSGTTIPLLSGLNSWGASQAFNAGATAVAMTNGIISHAATNVALTLLSSTVGRVQRDGYFTPGDIPSTVYTAATSACSLNAGAGDGGFQIPTSDGKCWVAGFTPGNFPLEQYGAKCDNSTDNLVILNKAVSSAISLYGSGKIVFPSGICRFSNSIEVSSGTIVFSGQGRDNTTITITSANDVFRFKGTAFDGGIYDLRVKTTLINPSAGFALQTSNGVGAIVMENVRVEGLFGGLSMTNSAVTGVVSLRNVYFAGLTPVTGDTILVNGASQLFLAEVTSFQATGNGNRSCLHLLDASGVYISNVTCGGSNIGLYVNPLSGQNVFDVFANNLEIDFSQGSAGGSILDSSGGGNIWGFRLSNMRVGFGAGPGFVFEGPSTSNVTLANYSSERNLSDGIQIYNLKNSQIISGQLLGNGAGGTASYGLNLLGGSNLAISDNIASASYPNQTPSAQNYGIAIQSSFSGSASISGGNVNGNITAGLINSYSGPNLTIRNVAGYNPVGVQYPSVPASGATYTNGSVATTVILSGGTCSNITVGGTSISPQCSYASFPLAANQTMVITYSATPQFYSMIQ